jgi:hypothetical protein
MVWQMGQFNPYLLQEAGPLHSASGKDNHQLGLYGDLVACLLLRLEKLEHCQQT